MDRAHTLKRALLLFLLISIASCNSMSAEEQVRQIELAVAGTVQAIETQTAIAAPALITPDLLEEVQLSTPTPTITQTATLAPTRPPPIIQVSVNTNCRSGPDASYLFLGLLSVGETSEVVAVSSVENYWYISNPDKPGEFCWLWGEYASVEGDTDFLPLYTPIPVPTSAVDFGLSLHSIRECGSDTYAVFGVRNTGGLTFQTGWIQVIDLDVGDDIHDPALDRHPFEPNARDCPPGHGNKLSPGVLAYIAARISPARSGNLARGIIKLCTEDYLGGECTTEAMDFEIK